MNSAHTERLLENAERRIVVLERICQQQEIELATLRDRNKLLDKRYIEDGDTIRNMRSWHNQTKWQKIKHIFGFKK